MKSILLCIVCIVCIVFPLGATCPVQAEGTLSSYDRSGNTTSQALLTPGFPQILGQPQLQIVIPGELASFSVVMADAHGLSFQWKFGGANIPDGTGDALLITNVTVVNQGGYAVVVANSFGSVTSSVAQLYIDSNGNGLPDSWELQYFGNLNQTAAGDFDHDGISNLQEFYDGTNPTNANSANWQLTILTDGGGVVGSSPTLLDYPSGQSVTLTASPNPPNQFYGWTGDLGTNINPAVVVMNTNKTIWARFTCFPPPQGLIAWWKGESDASDIIGGNNGTFYSGTTPVSATVTNSGKVGGAFTFDGTVYVQVPDAPSLRPAQFTLEAWVYPANWNGSQAIAARGSSVNENDAWWMGLNNGFPRFWADHAGNMSYIQSPTTIPTNQWSHLAISWDGGTNRLYVNGLLVASGGGTGPLQYDSGAVPVTIGVDWANNQPNAEHFSGRVDEVSLYNRALSDEEARDIYLSDVGGKCTNMPYFVTPPQLPYAVQQVGYVEQLSTVLGSPPVTYSVSAGTLPAGLTLSSSGLLGGIPATPATNVFAGLATDSAGMTREQVFSLQVLPPAMPTGLVAWWRAEGDALDAISTNNGVLTNGTGFAAGEVGLAFLFNGKTNYVQVGTNASLNFSNAMTFEGWIFPTGPGSDPTSGGTIISKEYQYEIARWADGTIRFAFANHTPGWNWVSSGYIAPLNQWTHIAVVYNGGAVSTYANGLLVNSYAGVGAIGVYSQGQNDFRIGGRQAISEYFQGQIDEASVYNRALSGAEVALIYNAGGAGKVSTGPYFVTPPALPDGIVNQAYSQIISSARGAAPVTYSIVSGNLPPGLSLNSGGVLSGAPTSTGSFSFTVSATDNAGAVNSQVFTLSIYASVLPPPGLISWWRAENNAVDSVGTNSGTLVNGAGFAQGVAGQAFAFTGYSSQSVAIPDSASLHPASVTLESWVMLRNPLPGYVTEAGILRKAVGSGYSNSYAIWLAEGGGGSGQNGSLNAQVGNDSAVGAALSYPFNPAPGVWFHVAYTFDDTTKQQTLYLNGNPVGSSTANLSIGYDNGSLALGSIGSPFGNYYLDGRMDETAIYSRALSANEIAAIYNAGSSGMTPTGPYFSTPPALPNGVVNQAYSQTFAIIHAAAPVTYSLGMSTLPPGLTLSSAGVLSGIPTTNGSFSFTVSATDNAALTGSQVFTLQVYAPVNPTSGLISWWRAEGNALDSIGTNNGTLVNGAIFGPGMAGQGFAFNGVNQSVDIPDSASLHPAAVTLEAWVIYAANNKYQVLFAKALGTGTLDSYTLWLDASGYLNGGVSDTSGFGPVLAAPYPLTPGQWYHVAFVFDNTSKQQSLYINGVLSAINVANKSIAYDSNVLSLGRDSENTAGAYFLNGRMDEAAIYGRALSANELAAIYNAGSAGKTTSGPYFSTPPALPIGILNVAYSQAFASARATPPVTYSLVSGTLPTGITLSSAGLLSGIPTSTGIFSFTVAATDNALLSNSQLFTLQVLTPLTPASLVGWWRAEGNAADSIGTNNGALANGTTFAPGLVGQAFLFNGTNQSVDIPDAPALRPASVTLEAWVMFLANSGFQTIFGKGLGNGALDSLSVWLDSAGTLNGEICDTVAASAISVPLLPTLGQWYHIAFTFDDSTHLETLYVNGSEAIGGVALKSIAYDSTPLTIGRDTDGGGPKYFLSGLVDEASIYNRALTGSEIASIFSAGAAGKASAGPYFVTGPSLSNAFIGQSYTQTFATARGVSPVSYALIQGQIPPGMSLNPAGILSGVPTSSGQFVFTIQATDFATQVAIQSFTLNVFRQVPLSPGLVAWWRGEGNALDSAGTNNGTLVGGVTFASGEFGQAFSLNGASGFIKIPDAPALRPPSFTLQCWAQFNSAGGQQALLAKPFGSGVADSFIFYLNNGVLDGGLTAASLNYSDITYPFVPIEGRWYHLAFSFNALSGQEALYVDGVQVANQLTTLTVGYGTNSMILGADNDNGSPTLYLNGRIDEVCVYNRELSPAEIASFWTTDVPNLSIAPAGLNLLNLFWPATGNFTLQQSSDLVSGIWTDSYYPISSNNGTNGVTIAPTTGNLFFRLRQ